MQSSFSLLQVTSGDPADIRPESAEPWTPDEMAPTVSVVLSENPDEPTYLEAVRLTTLENVDEVQIRIVRTFNGPEEVVETDTVSFID